VEGLMDITKELAGVSILLLAAEESSRER